MFAILLHLAPPIVGTTEIMTVQKFDGFKSEIPVLVSWNVTDQKIVQLGLTFQMDCLVWGLTIALFVLNLVLL